VRGRIAIAKSLGWAIYAAGFAIWLFGYLSAGHAPLLIGKGPRRGGFLVLFLTLKRNSDLRSCSRVYFRFMDAKHGSASNLARLFAYTALLVFGAVTLAWWGLLA
jgi:hypothetical protein